MAAWQHQGRAGLPVCAHRAEQAGRFVTLIGLPSRSRPLARPDADAAGLLADAGLVLNPDLDRPVCRTVVQRGGKALGDVFLKASMRPGSWPGAWGLGRVLRASGEARKAGRCRQPGESPLVRDNTAPVFDPPLKVKSSPADPPPPPPSGSSVMLKAGAGFDDLSKFSHRGRGTRRSNSPSGPASLNRCRRSACSRLTVFARCPAG